MCKCRYPDALHVLERSRSWGRTVILTDTGFPGWRAKVDRKTVEIYQAYGGVRGVMVDGGRHVIEMRYLPWSVFLGGALTLLAAVVAVAASRGAANPGHRKLSAGAQAVRR